MFNQFITQATLFKPFLCFSGNPLNCQKLQYQGVDTFQSKKCATCGFPSLIVEKNQIRGKEGRYQVQKAIGHRGLGRLYQGTSLIHQRAVIIKEYFLLKDCFSISEIRSRQRHFQQFSDLQLIDGRKPKFRVIIPKEVIIDSQQQRCYAITDIGISAIPLQDYLEKYGKMDEEVVWQVLDQVSQSLFLLHSQKFRFSSGLHQIGIAHGNLSLESLLILSEDQSFLIYLTDLALWEGIFASKNASKLSELSSSEAVRQDLSDLGYVAFYLLVGTSIDPQGKPLDPYQDEYWGNIRGIFKDYLFNLMGLGTISLNTAELARKELLKIRPQLIPSTLNQTVLSEPLSKEVNSRRWWWLGGGILGLFLLCLLIYWIVTKNRTSQPNSFRFFGKTIDQVFDIPSEKIKYNAIQGSSWDYVYTSPNLIRFGQTFEEFIKKKQPSLSKWEYRALATNNPNYILNNYDNFNFSITSPLYPLSTQYQTFPFAYDAIAVFVAFNYSKRQDGLPDALKGTITLEQLRKLYTGKVKNWRELDASFPDLPVKLYIPADPEVEAIFKAKVLRDPQSIAQYEALINASAINSLASDSIIKSDRQIKKSVVRLRTYGKDGILQSIIRDFEDSYSPIGSISFDSLSKIIGQCSVYPLAISSTFSSPISPLVRDNQQSINSQTNLCNQKGSYTINYEAIRNQIYPLTYPLAVVYLRDNRRQLVGDKFAEILTTKEGQCLLQAVQLTSIYSVKCSQP